MSDELLIIDPVDVQFPIELNKKVSCSLNLTNKTENYVAFKVKLIHYNCLHVGDFVYLRFQGSIFLG